MPEAKNVTWAPFAKRDLRDIWRYYARVGSPEVADRLLREIDRAGVLLERRYHLGRKRDELMPGLQSVIVHPHTIFYRVSDASVEVVRVLHERRDFPGIFSKDETR
ncbi:toxin ParE1/3/4 [Rhizobiales bacterium GAS191]|nr:toxin ParE1/3/4 [Rhizobiales bacterium GAS191]